MDILIDTNIIYSDFRLGSRRFEALFDYIKKTESRLILPRVVFEEAVAHFQREMQRAVDSLRKSVKEIDEFRQDGAALPVAAVDVAAQVQAFRTRLLRPKADLPTLVLENRPEDLSEMVHRLVSRRKPAAKGTEARDVLIWLTISQYLRANADRMLAFISVNKNDFGGSQDKTQLHEELSAELGELNSRFSFYTSLDAFLSENEEPIRGVDRTWVQSILTPETLGSLVFQVVQDESHKLLSSLSSHEGSIEDARPLHVIETYLHDYYVYEMNTRERYVNATCSVYVELEIEVQVDHSVFEDTVYREIETCYRKVEVVVSVSALLREGTLQAPQIDDWHVEPVRISLR